MTDVAEVAPLSRMVQVAGVAAEHLPGRLEKYPGVRNQPRDRDARIVDPIFAAHQILRDQRPVGPRKHVVVQSVDLAERRAHLADSHQQSPRQRRERHVAFLEADTFFAEGDEEIGARVRIDDRLK